jgi:hypothetical protein
MYFGLHLYFLISNGFLEGFPSIKSHIDTFSAPRLVFLHFGTLFRALVHFSALWYTFPHLDTLFRASIIFSAPRYTFPCLDYFFRTSKHFPAPQFIFPHFGTLFPHLNTLFRASIPFSASRFLFPHLGTLFLQHFPHTFSILDTFSYQFILYYNFNSKIKK